MIWWFSVLAMKGRPAPLDSDRRHGFRINQIKTPSLAEHANLLAKHAKQKLVVFLAKGPLTNAEGERHATAATVIITRVRFPSHVPLIIKHLRRCASKVQVNCTCKIAVISPRRLHFYSRGRCGDFKTLPRTFGENLGSFEVVTHRRFPILKA